MLGCKQSNLLRILLFLISPWGGCWRCWQFSTRKATGVGLGLSPPSGQRLGDFFPSKPCPSFVSGTRETEFPNKQVESPLEGCRAQFLIALTDDIVYLPHCTLVFESFSYLRDLWQAHFSNFPKATGDLETKCAALSPVWTILRPVKPQSWGQTPVQRGLAKWKAGETLLLPIVQEFKWNNWRRFHFKISPLSPH